MKDKLVAVVWDDAHVDQGASFTRSEIAERIAPQFVTFGVLVRDDERSVAVAAEVCPDDGSLRGVTYVPRSMVREIVPLGCWPKRTRAKPQPVSPS